MTDKIKVAIVRHNGLFMGGTEKFLQIMAAEVNKDKFEVDFFTTNAMRFKDREKYLKDRGVNIIKFHKLNWRNFPKLWMNKINYFWFWLKFKKNYYDVVQITNFSWDEYPYNSFYGENVCQFVVFAPFCDFPCIKLSILNSQWLKDKWVSTGGNADEAVVIPVPTWKPLTDENMRKELGIADDVFVCGFHQRKHDDIFSDVQLKAYDIIENDKTHMIVLNGSDLYKKQAEELMIKNITFIDYLKTEEDMSRFFNTLDLYTHGRKDGETYGTIFVEAMIHGVPCISHLSGIQDAMEETIGKGGYVVERNPNTYAQKISEVMSMSKEDYKQLCEDARNESLNRFTYDVVIPKIEESWKYVAGRTSERPVF